MDRLDINKLRKAPMLRELTDEEWKHFLNHAKAYGRSYSKGQIIYLEGDECESADIILSGSLHVKRHDVEGRTFMVERFSMGDMIGANLLFSSEALYPMTIMSESDCIIVSISKEQILKWCQSNELFLESYLNEISDKTKVLVQAVKKISTGTLRENLMVYFDELLVEDLEGGMDSRTIILPITKKELAERYGVARTSLSRELKRMEEDELIRQIDSRRIKILTK